MDVPFSVPLFKLEFDEAEERAVVDVMRSRWISMGPRTEELERRFAERLGVKHVLALTNCTAALHLAVVACGIGPGDEVIVPSLTFVATVNSVRYVGARPVFADIVGPVDLAIDPAHVESLITPRTRAVICMHYGGFAADLTRLAEICERRGIALIEDAAHAPASFHRGRAVGSVGRAGCFSFYANKNLTCAEGGLLTTDDDAVAAKVKLMRSHGMTTLSYDRAHGHAMAYDVVESGYNYRLDDIRAAITLAQLDKLDADIERRRAIRADYCAKLAALAADVHVPYGVSDPHSSEYIFPVVLKRGGAGRRDRVRRFMADRGIQTSVHYPPAHRFQSLIPFAGPVPRTDFVADHEVTLPMFGRLTGAEVASVVSTLRDAVKACPETE